MLAITPRPTASQGAPNIIVMLADDLGYSDLGCYGSEIPTPNLEAQVICPFTKVVVICLSRVGRIPWASWMS